jgi:probable F420-dependent oxidoreductase
VKVRIGISLGVVSDASAYDKVLDRLEESGVDSLWLSDLVSAGATDPLIGLAYAAARTRRLKLGTGVAVLPGRNPVLFAKQLASLAALAPGRILPSLGLAPAQPADADAYPVPPGRRGAVFDEALTVVRALLEQPEVSFQGEFFTLRGVGIGQRPARRLDIWLGGTAPGALRRIGRLADGWLASFVTPAEAAAGIATINDAAAAAGRHVEDDHFGISLPIAFDGIPEPLAAAIRRRRADADLAALIPTGWDGAKRAIADYVTAGVTKFVIRPATPTPSWDRFIEEFVARLHPLET